ncbi:molybdopterin-binding protein [Oxalobacter vibrioformis]|uniref:Molybdopterin-binding protein n=1 Tax=Oxalobacter vibrioformis TaxID=933080 RepID=A0A9E9LY99_9BURK|nr:molybdopterin-binding protein [Oxalobacter vibrioformis]WAW10571.1 molybdopterin-binding protein [Oxalobacter vibrioformis]
MAIGLIIIGDEILSGKRTDRHFSAAIGMLKKRGMQLDWAEYLSDDPQKITATLRRTFATGDMVFSCGGIGATPDDHTRRCAARALDVPLVLHPEAREKILERIRDFALQHGRPVDYDAPDNLQRLRMGEFPEGAAIILNPVNKIPGFSVGTHYFFPGFPEMAHPMMEWVLDTYHQADFFRIEHVEKSVTVYGAVEAMMTPMMEEIEREFQQIRVFSLPHIGMPGGRSYVELGVKGASAEVDEAFARLQEGLRQIHAEYEINP